MTPSQVYLIHLSVYTRASIATHWVTLEHGAEEHITPPFKEDGFYLVRLILDPNPSCDVRYIC